MASPCSGALPLVEDSGSFFSQCNMACSIVATCRVAFSLSLADLLRRSSRPGSLYQGSSQKTMPWMDTNTCISVLCAGFHV